MSLQSYSVHKPMSATIDENLKAKCPRTAPRCVTAYVEASASPVGLVEEIGARAEEILLLPEPRTILESPQILATRAAIRRWGKIRRGIAGRQRR